MTYSVRQATEDDRDRIVLFNQAMARETEGYELDRKVLSAGVEKILGDPGRGFYFVAVTEDEIVGQVMTTTEWSDWRNGFVWWIQSVYISKRHRRSGVYRLLHEHVRDLARRKRAVGLRLFVDRDNEPAQATYESLGMRPSQYIFFEEMWAR